MKLLASDSKGRRLRLLIETEEDLWDLYNVIKRGDVVYARTTRELKARSGSRRKSMLLGLRVEWTSLQKLMPRLRIHGIIIQGPRELDLEGLHHTIAIGLGSEVEVVKEKGWPEPLLDRILRACRRSRVGALFIGIDYEEACVALVKDYNIRVLEEVALRLPGKESPEERRLAIETKLRELLCKIADYCNIYKPNAVVISGPGPLKDLLAFRLSERLSIPVCKESASSGGYAGILEAIRRGAILRVLKESSIAKETALMEEFLSLLSRNDSLVALSLDEVEYVLSQGAVKRLLVSSSMMYSSDEQLRRRIERLLKEAERTRAEVVIFSSESEAHIQLRGLGGVVAILRYPVPRFRRS